MKNDLLVVALDMDDVVLAFTEGVISVINRDYDVQLSRENVRDWYFGRYGLDEALGRDWWDWMKEHAWLWSEKFKPVPGAIGFVEDMRRNGYDLELITSKPPWAEHHVYSWLGKYFKGPSFNRVIIHDSTQSSEAPVTKAALSDADVLVDDRDKNVMEWVESDPHRTAILFDAPWNQSMWTGEHVAEPYDRIFRARNFHEVRDILAQLEEVM